MEDILVFLNLSLSLSLSLFGTPQYDVSDTFSPAPLRNRLYDVMRILKRIGQAIAEKGL